MTKKDLQLQIDFIKKDNEMLTRTIYKQREIIDLILDHLKLDVKEEDYVGVNYYYTDNTMCEQQEKVVKTRQVLVPRPKIRDKG